MPSTPGVGPFRRLYYRWRSLQLPWRKKWLVGSDLEGNTFWEFKDALNANRMRRIMQYGTETHYGDIKLSPQWHQWLRHTRPEPPSLLEQQQDEFRQVRMKELARLADERWAAKESQLEPPRANPASLQMSKNLPQPPETSQQPQEHSR